MRALAGQAAGGLGRGGVLLTRFLLAASLILGLGVLALAWRLEQGPIALPALAQALERQAADEQLPLRVGRAELAWAGWGEHRPLPMVLRLGDLELLGADGRPRLLLAGAEARLSLARLLRGRVVPEWVGLRDAELLLDRAADGTVTLGLPPGRAAAATPPGGPRIDAPPVDSPADPLTPLLRPDGPLSALQAVRLDGVRLRLRDEARGLEATLLVREFEARRRGDGVEAEGEAVLRAGGAELPLSLRAHSAGPGGAVEARAALRVPRPAALAGLDPALAPLLALDAPAELLLEVRHDPAAPAATVPRLELRLGPGSVAPPGMGRVFFSSLAAVAAAEPDGAVDPTAASLPPLRALRLDSLRLQLAPARPAGAAGPVIAARGAAGRAEGGWRGALDLSLDRASMAELRAHWPEGLAPGARDWVVGNITAGTAQDGRWRFVGAADADGGNPRLLEASGRLGFSGGTVHWLRPVPPAEGASGVLRLVNPTELVVELRGGRQSGTALLVPEGTARISQLGTQEQMDLDLRVAGPLSDALDLLRHPRLRLFERRPLDLKEPGGTLETAVSLSFPLVVDLPAERLLVRARGRGREVRLADVVAGQSLRNGAMEFEVNNDGLRVNGGADLGPVRGARLGVELDFRNGSAAQVVTRYRAEGRTEAANLEAFGLDLAGTVRGPVAATVLAEGRRDGGMRVALRGDLRDSTMEFGPLGWGKAQGVAASAEGSLRVQGPRLEAVEGLRVEAPGLSLRGRAAFADAARLRRLEFGEGRIGETRISAGEVEPPARPGEPWRIAARGPAVDLRAVFGGEAGGNAPAPTPAAAPPPVPIQIDAGFDRVRLEGGELRDLRASLRTDSRGALLALRATGATTGAVTGATTGATTGAAGGLEVAVTPDRTGQRALSLRADDAGALLRAFGVLRQVEGGRLRVEGHWRGEGADAPLLGTAELDEFSVRDAPAVAKLLQAITVFGVFDAARGPGLHFARMHAPFALTRDALGLEDAQAFSASLGLTARGRIGRRTDSLDIEGTIVPAYALNSLLGRLPLIGRLFSPEAGGGLFAATYRVRGPAADPSVSVNPLAALTPGFLRGIFSAAPPEAPAR